MKNNFLSSGRLALAAGFLITVLSLSFLAWLNRSPAQKLPVTANRQPSPVSFRPSPTPSPAQPTPTSNRKILLAVPFTSQAPLGDWQDQRQQDGCEEASTLMAVRWARGQSLTNDEALREILKMADWQIEKYGSARDTNPQDTVERLFKGYFGYPQVVVRPVGSPQDIIQVLENNQLVITPMDGQLLANPNYTAPGPERHMVIVRGYDPQTQEFITNDGGTRRGELYRYPIKHYYEAIRVYPTGDHLPIEGPIVKEMIVVSQP